jgi:hypothetical protein
MHDRHCPAMPQVTAVDEQFGTHSLALDRHTSILSPVPCRQSKRRAPWKKIHSIELVIYLRLLSDDRCPLADASKLAMQM